MKKFHDPAGTGPFQAEPAGEGFVLRSTMLEQGKPVELTFGGRLLQANKRLIRSGGENQAQGCGLAILPDVEQSGD